MMKKIPMNKGYFLVKFLYKLKNNSYLRNLKFKKYIANGYIRKH